MSFRESLDACKSATHSDATFVGMPQQFLHEHGLETDVVLHTFAGNFPLWRPDPNNQGLFRVSSEKAFKSGWRRRAFAETAFDCLNDFYSAKNIDRPNFLSGTKEKEVLSVWAHRRA